MRGFSFFMLLLGMIFCIGMTIASFCLGSITSPQTLVCAAIWGFTALWSFGYLLQMIGRDD